MARPVKYNVDYFPHYISSGKKMSVLQSRYGNDGYAVWFKILEQLGDTDFHYLDLNNKLDFHYLANNVCLVSEETLVKILNDLAEFGEINAELWKIKVVWSEKFMSSIADAYKRRECRTKDLAGLLRHIKDNNCKLAGLLHTLSTLNEHLSVLMHAETELMHAKSTEREREREREIKGIEEKETKTTEIPEIDPNKKNEGEEIPRPNPWGLYSSMDDLKTVLLSHKSWQSDFGISLGIQNPEDVPKWIEKFFIFCKGTGKNHEKESDAKSHFYSWTRRQMELGKTVNDESVSKPNIVDDANPPDNPGTKNEERIGKWMWLNNGWRDTTTFAEHRKQHYGIK